MDVVFQEHRSETTHQRMARLRLDRQQRDSAIELLVRREARKSKEKAALLNLRSATHQDDYQSEHRREVNKAKAYFAACGFDPKLLDKWIDCELERFRASIDDSKVEKEMPLIRVFGPPSAFGTSQRTRGVLQPPGREAYSGSVPDQTAPQSTEAYSPRRLNKNPESRIQAYPGTLPTVANTSGGTHRASSSDSGLGFSTAADASMPPSDSTKPRSPSHSNSS